MKNLLNVLLVVLALVTIAAVTYAGTSGGTAPAVGKVNVPLTVPKVAKAACVSMTTGKSGTASIDVSGTTMLNWKAFNSDTDATAVTLKRKFNSNTAYFPASGESNLPIEANASTVVFAKYSAASNATTPRICYDLN